MAYKLTINGYSPPAVTRSGYSVTKNKIWSSNTGRGATGKMLGDIIATKYTIRAQWNKLTQSQLIALENAIGSKAFFSVTFVNEKGAHTTKTFYSADPTYTTKKFVNGVAVFENVSIELIEQ